MKACSKDIALHLVFMFLVSIFLFSEVGAQSGLSDLSGNILIKITDDKHYEYRLALKSDSFEKYIEHNVPKVSNPEEYRTPETDYFFEARKRLKPDTSRPLESATDFFSYGELLSIDAVHRKVAFCSLNCSPNEVEGIKPKADQRTIDMLSRDIHKLRIMPNRQSTYAIVSPRYPSGSSAIIVDISKKETITPICNEKLSVKDMEWSPDGRYIAFSTGSRGPSFSALWIYDVNKLSFVLRKNFGDRTDISSLAWNPSSNAVAVLTRESGFTKNPFNCCCFMPAGHPQIYTEYSLKICNFENEAKSVNSFLKITGSGHGVILWDN